MGVWWHALAFVTHERAKMSHKPGRNVTQAGPKCHTRAKMSHSHVIMSFILISLVLPCLVLSCADRFSFIFFTRSHYWPLGPSLCIIYIIVSSHALSYAFVTSQNTMYAGFPWLRISFMSSFRIARWSVVATSSFCAAYHFLVIRLWQILRMLWQDSCRFMWKKCCDHC